MSEEFENLPGMSGEDTAEFSLDELIRSTKEEIARVDEMMGLGDTAEDAAGPEDFEEEAASPAAQMPAFEPQLPEEYADLSVEEEEAAKEAAAAAAAAEEEEARRRSGLPAGVKVLLYVCCVLAASVLLAIGAWKCADDLLALTKPDMDVTVTVAENASIEDVTRELHDKELVNYPWLFQFYCWFSHAEQKIVPGTYELNAMYDYHALVNGMRQASAQRATVTVMVPEGYECADIFAMLEENGVCSAEDLRKTAASYAFDYDFLQDLPYGEDNRLEGYLFPDTYEFYVDDEPENVLGKFLRNFDSKFTDEMRAAIDDLNDRLHERYLEGGFSEEDAANGTLTMQDVITVASLVEKETAKTSESANIASVIYNRLTSQLYPCLQIDATIQYALAERKETLTNADKEVISPYNTYKNAGLPVGPIANPGMGSIRAALYPADTNYYFYALGDEGVHHFSENYYEHQDFLDETE